MNLFDPQVRFLILGAGGLGKEVLCSLKEQWGWEKIGPHLRFVEEDSFYKPRKVLDVDVISLSDTDPTDSFVVIAIGGSADRARIASALPSGTKYATVIDSSARVTPYSNIGPGSIILAQCFISCDVEIGSHSVINPLTSISHDCNIGHYFTTGPGVNISGNCKIGNHVFLGTNSSVRNEVRICDNVIVGIGGVVTKDIDQPGTYIGNPAKLVNQE